MIKVYVNMPFSETGTGLTDFVIVSSGASSVNTVSVAVIVLDKPIPLIVAVCGIVVFIRRRNR